MKSRVSKENLILISGMIGIIAALLTAISDMILLGRPVSAYTFFEFGTESMAELAQWRIIAGTFIGVFALPFQIMGTVPLYYGLKSAGSVMAGVVFGTAAYALVMGVAFHVSYAYIGSGWSVNHDMGVGNSTVSEMMTRFDLYWKIIIIAVAAGLLVSSVCYVFLVLTGKTLYPKWMAVLNPVCIFLVLFPLIILIPAPVGGYIAPAYMNLAALMFFVLALINVFGKKALYKGNNI